MNSRIYISNFNTVTLYFFNNLKLKSVYFLLWTSVCSPLTSLSSCDSSVLCRMFKHKYKDNAECKVLQKQFQGFKFVHKFTKQELSWNLLCFITIASYLFFWFVCIQKIMETRTHWEEEERRRRYNNEISNFQSFILKWPNLI